MKSFASFFLSRIGTKILGIASVLVFEVERKYNLEVSAALNTLLLTVYSDSLFMRLSLPVLL